MPLSPSGQLSLPFWARTLYTVLLLHPNPETQTFPPTVQMESKAILFIPLRGLEKKHRQTSLCPHLSLVARENYSPVSDLSSGTERTSEVKARPPQWQSCYWCWQRSAASLSGLTLQSTCSSLHLHVVAGWIRIRDREERGCADWIAVRHGIITISPHMHAQVLKLSRSLITSVY